MRMSLKQETRVSKLNMPQSNHDTNQQFKKRLKAPSADDESCAPLLMSELQSAIKKMKGKGAAGPGNIPLSFHSVLWPSRNYYPYSTHHSHLLTAHKSGGLPLSLHYSKLESLLVK